MLVMMNFEQLKKYFIDSLKDQYKLREINSFFFLLLENVKKWNRIDFNLQRLLVVDQEEELIFQNAIHSLKEEVPIQYIIGSVFFYDFSLKVNKSVLIPRPETEELVSLIENNYAFNPPVNILDIGTGSGCIILALKKIFPTSECFAIDLSNEAINVAKENASALSLEVNFTVEDVFNVDLKNLFDLIVSNPPYITLEERKNMSPNVLNHEPHSALFVYDKDPLLFYRSIAEIGLNNLNNNGKIYFEINEEYGHEVVSLLRELGYVNCMLIKDMQQKNRFVSAILK